MWYWKATGSRRGITLMALSYALELINQRDWIVLKASCARVALESVSTRGWTAGQHSVNDETAGMVQG